MTTTWIVAADASRARVLQVTDREQLLEVEDFLNPEGRLHNREIDSDARGRFPGGNTWQPEVDAVEHQNEQFAKRVADYLDKARTEHRYDRLVIAAPPKYLGQLRKSLPREVEKLVADELPKDLSRLSAREIERFFAKSGYN